MKFNELLACAQSGNSDAVMEIMEMYEPLLVKKSMVGCHFDEDLYQELRTVLLNCIRNFT